MWPNVVLICCLVVAALSQRPPPTPCPAVFKYENDGYQWYGIIAAPNPPPYGSDMRLVLKMSLDARLPSEYVGRIDLYESGETVLQRMRYGQAIYYKVYFPLSYPIPQVVTILFNERLICYGPAAFGSSVTTLNLHHLFRSGDQYVNNSPAQAVNGILQMLGVSNQTPAPQTNEPDIIYIDLDNPQNSVVQKPTTPKPIPTKSPNPVNNPNYEIQVIDPNNPYANRPVLVNKIKPTTPASVNFECGVTESFVQLVTNGKKAVRGDWPWLVALFWRKRTTPGEIKKEFKCGATLVSDKVVLTAAHCVTGAQGVLRPEEILLKIGAYDIDDEADEASILRAAYEVIVREDYNERFNDLAALRLRQPVVFTQYIKPVCLWEGPVLQTQIWGKTGTVVGWGKDETGAGIISEPRVASVPIISTTECRASHPNFFHLTSNTTLCAGAKDGTGPCTGDSGGGLFIKKGDRWRIRGIVSKALKNDDDGCNLNEYVIYTDLAKFRPWINKIVRKRG